MNHSDLHNSMAFYMKHAIEQTAEHQPDINRQTLLKIAENLDRIEEHFCRIIDALIIIIDNMENRHE